MIARFFAIVAIAGVAVLLFPLLRDAPPVDELSRVAEGYVTRSPDELGAQNVVTAVVVTYRGLDTLGEVTVLFIATAGIGFLLRRSFRAQAHGPLHSAPGQPVAEAERPMLDGDTTSLSEPSEILTSGARILIPLVIIFGVYTFLHGHLTPGGGFQGGVLIAAAALLHFLSASRARIGHGLLTFIESLSGVSYVVVGILGIVLAAGFLDARLLPLGQYGRLISAGAIPVIYSLVGLKVGAEL
ncbi:MAG: hydrogen gas-evolving membrane-bound hydrogenase subunit E, partial [Spirochaetota bacterium]